jgi:hypothetical protein
MKMTMTIDLEVMEMLIERGLDADDSPVHVAEGFEVRNLKIRTNNTGASFALVQVGDNSYDDEDED